MKAVFIIAAGSGLGGVARYGLQMLVYRLYPARFPFGTFSVNLIGCFLIGMFLSLAERHNTINHEMKLFFITGFCGGFTTFSTFSAESLDLLRAGELWLFILYASGSVITGILMTWLGMQFIKNW